MTDYTKHLRLIKPGGNDYYNIDDFNQNAELIDKETEKLSNAVTKIQEGATREKAGIVQYGTTEGKALEGMMLARMFGCVGYGGDIQDPGAKNVNYVYFDKNTRKMYKCLNQNSDVSANVANFIPLDNNSLLDRLENLIKVEILSMSASIGYTASLNVTEWYVTLPSHIKKERIISLSNMNQASCFEYCNLDLGANCIRVGSQGNASATNIKDIKVIVAYFS